MSQTPTVPTVPFEIASQYSIRPSFQVTPTALQPAALTRTSPIQVPAVGFIRGILLEVTVTGTGGTAPALQPDAPWNVIQNISFRNAGGTNLISPTNGYQLYLQNKYSGAGLGLGASADPRAGIQYSATAPSAHFFLWLNLDIDPSEAYGAIPALSASQNYQLELGFSSINEIFTGTPSAATVAVDASVHYFDQPPATDLNGSPQAVEPAGSPATSIWQIEQKTVSPGTQLLDSTNVGGVIRNHILVLRNAAGARIDASEWPNLMELLVDNQSRFSLQKSDWEFLMSRWYGLLASSKNVVNGLDTGVFVLPYHSLTGSQAGDPANTRANLMPTLNATLLQFRAQDFGPNVSRLEIITQSISTTNSAYLYSK